jgi:Flp pilus assembly protein CpaB
VENLLPKGMLGTPRRTVIAGVGALVLATVLLLAYLSHYRSSVKSASANVPVLRAKSFIPQGTTALSLAKRGLFEVTAIPKDQLKDGAVTDAAVLHGEVALGDIYPGQQLTVADFGVTATSSALSGSPDLLGTADKTGTWRALSVPLDSSHGISPQVQTGDHVDVYAQMTARSPAGAGSVLGLLMANVLVLAAPNQVAAGTAAPTSSNYILRVPTNEVPRFAFAADNGHFWFALRPQKSAKPTNSAFATSDNVFAGRFGQGSVLFGGH